MAGVVVVKLGGSILDSPQGFAYSSLKVKERFVEAGISPIVVVSAMKGVTDLLLEAVRRDPRVLGVVESRYVELAKDLGSPVLERAIRAELTTARRTLGTLKLPPSPPVVDYVLSLGERLSRLAMEHYLAHAGLRSAGFDARSLVVTNRVHGDARVIEDVTRGRVQALLKAVSKGVVPVIEGFVGSTLEGAVTTLGRGGSDYTATILAKLLGAGEVYLVTDVDGVYSIDPAIDENAVLVPRISLREAIAASTFRVKGFNRKTFLPLRGTSIVVSIGSWKRFGSRVSGLYEGSESGRPKILSHKAESEGARVGVIGYAASALAIKRILEIVDSEGFLASQVIYDSRSPLSSILVSPKSHSCSLNQLLLRIHREVILQGPRGWSRWRS